MTTTTTVPAGNPARAAAVTAAITRMADMACEHRRQTIDLAVSARRIGYFKEWVGQLTARAERAEAQAAAAEFTNRRMAGEIHTLRRRLAFLGVPV